MSWIKKVLSYLQQEEKEEQVKRSAPLSKKESSAAKKGNQMDTKMVYQYPKGAFRFPIIPDEKTERPQREESPKKNGNNYDAERKASERVYDEKIKVKKEGSKKPFTPTEVPSPIYGFQKRPVKPEIEEIEYELPVAERKINPFKPAVFTSEKASVYKQQTPTEKTELKEEAAAEEKTVLSSENPFEIRGGTSFTGIDRESTEEETGRSSANENTSVETVSSDLPSAETQATDEKPAPLHLVPDSHRDDEEEDNYRESEKEKITVNSDEDEPLDQELPVSEEVKSEQTAPVKKEKKGGSLPFNVLMLKQDRRKARDREQKKTVNNQQDQVASQGTHHVNEPHEEDTVIPNASLENAQEELSYFAFPSMDLLMPPIHAEVDQDWLDEQTSVLDDTLFSFNVNAKVKHVTQGPSVTRFEIFPEKGVKVSKITGLTDDIKLSLAARDIRMEAPIPGKMAVGIEIPNPSSRPVALKEILDHPAFKESSAALPIALGLDIEGQPVVTDIGKMPHGLIAGATGSGKSVCINSILISLLYHSSPDDLKLLLIDPKMVELAPYNHIPHLVSPVITDVKAATAALKWAVEEMERRYQLFAHAGVRDISKYNQKAKEAREFNKKLPYLVIVIDELADLMMMSPADVEEAICRIAQKARACGIHLLIATQRPSVDVITGLIKANVPTRVAFSVSSQVDSRTIIDTSGADRLLGRGDMLFLGNGASKPIRLQGTFVSDDEIDAVVSHVRKEREVNYLFHQEELLAKVEIQEEEDELLIDACELVVSHGGASTSLLQRQFRIGYNRAARLIDMMEKQGWISEAKGSKPRDVLMTNEDLESLQNTGTSQ
ncbi:DNA translocase FtsK [Jeotgalibacillus sp. ET6]|uniref:DNA translocase FtsK n=1 Tax=Jeotgalibacillus sp. ET6 TaxID=3037260 RepID=UPI0024188F88|nr:DNA translocase FtsK [Jeotgalibacillus sp. ET6]MDG5473477.1 DNA translocase FtsK [Jeotgalibacillus sp. ET6]